MEEAARDSLFSAKSKRTRRRLLLAGVGACVFVLCAQQVARKESAFQEIRRQGWETMCHCSVMDCVPLGGQRGGADWKTSIDARTITPSNQSQEKDKFGDHEGGQLEEREKDKGNVDDDDGDNDENKKQEGEEENHEDDQREKTDDQKTDDDAKTEENEDGKGEGIGDDHQEAVDGESVNGHRNNDEKDEKKNNGEDDDEVDDNEENRKDEGEGNEERAYDSQAEQNSNTENETKEPQSSEEENSEPRHIARKYAGPFEMMDDLLTGKSCLYETPPDEPKADMRWRCFDCGDGEQTEKGNGNGKRRYISREECKPMLAKGRCYENRIEMEPWDEPPRAHSFFNPRVSNAFPTSQVMKHFGFEFRYERADCSVSLPCFDISRCPRDEPVKVYGYPGVAEWLANDAANEIPDVVTRVETPEEACILFVASDSFSTFEDLENSTHWRGGQNHFIWKAETVYGAHGDRPFGENNLEMAALAHTSLTDAHFRLGYDIALHLIQLWGRPQKFDTLDIHRPRRLLVSFKGRVEPWPLPFQHHRWLAAEFWDYSSSDVYVDGSCHVGYSVDTDEEAYGELLLNSTFVFAPGGGGVSSFRMAEAISADAIPVVLSNLVTPYSPEVNWEGCVVRISEARIVDLPDVLRRIPDKEVRQRRERCRTLFLGVIGTSFSNEGKSWTNAGDREGFHISMMVWQQRIQMAHIRAEAWAAIDQDVETRASQEDKFLPL